MLIGEQVKWSFVSVLNRGIRLWSYRLTHGPKVAGSWTTQQNWHNMQVPFLKPFWKIFECPVITGSLSGQPSYCLIVLTGKSFLFIPSQNLSCFNSCQFSLIFQPLFLAFICASSCILLRVSCVKEHRHSSQSCAEEKATSAPSENNV